MDTSEHSALGRMVERPRSGLRAVGVQVDFYVKAYAGIPIVLRRYLGEVLRQLTSISFGTGALVLIGGSVVVVAILTASAGAVVGLQGYGPSTRSAPTPSPASWRATSTSGSPPR